MCNNRLSAPGLIISQEFISGYIGRSPLETAGDCILTVLPAKTGETSAFLKEIEKKDAKNGKKSSVKVLVGSASLNIINTSKGPTRSSQKENNGIETSSPSGSSVSSNQANVVLSFEIPNYGLNWEMVKIRNEDIKSVSDAIEKSGLREEYGKEFLADHDIVQIFDNAIPAIHEMYQRSKENQDYEGKINFTLSLSDKVAELIIEDNGIGIAPKTMNGLFIVSGKDITTKPAKTFWGGWGFGVSTAYNDTLRSAPGSFVEFVTRHIDSDKAQVFTYLFNNHGLGEKSSIKEAERTGVGTTIKFVFPLKVFPRIEGETSSGMNGKAGSKIINASKGPASSGSETMAEKMKEIGQWLRVKRSEKGEAPIIFFSGPPATGKSTMIRAIVETLLKEKGIVDFDWKDGKSDLEKKEARRELANYGIKHYDEYLEGRNLAEWLNLIQKDDTVIVETVLMEIPLEWKDSDRLLLVSVLPRDESDRLKRVWARDIDKKRMGDQATIFETPYARRGMARPDIKNVIVVRNDYDMNLEALAQSFEKGLVGSSKIINASKGPTRSSQKENNGIETSSPSGSSVSSDQKISEEVTNAGFAPTPEINKVLLQYIFPPNDYIKNLFLELAGGKQHDLDDADIEKEIHRFSEALSGYFYDFVDKKKNSAEDTKKCYLELIGFIKGELESAKKLLSHVNNERYKENITDGIVHAQDFIKGIEVLVSETTKNVDINEMFEIMRWATFSSNYRFRGNVYRIRENFLASPKVFARQDDIAYLFFSLIFPLRRVLKVNLTITTQEVVENGKRLAVIVMEIPQDVDWKRNMVTRNQDTGLGLKLAQLIAQKYDGSVISETLSGGGLRFIVKLPVSVKTEISEETVPTLGTGETVESILLGLSGTLNIKNPLPPGVSVFDFTIPDGQLRTEKEAPNGYDPKWGTVVESQMGKFVLLQLAPGQKGAIVSTEHTVCTRVDIRALWESKVVMIGHVHLIKLF
ncbi:MAG: hypothetical protein NT079_05680 [Candidatus Omnitrophica bacterium]|nr:hypothetical protein [Candidatus Omnitrophota bacterium]